MLHVKWKDDQGTNWLLFSQALCCSCLSPNKALHQTTTGNENKVAVFSHQRETEHSVPDNDLTWASLWREVPRWWGWRQSLVLRLKEQPDHSVYLDHQHLVRLLEPSSESFLSERLSGDLPRQQSVLQSPGCWRRKGYVCTCMCVWNSPKTVSRSQCRSGERGSDLTHSD